MRFRGYHRGLERLNSSIELLAALPVPTERHHVSKLPPVGPESDPDARPIELTHGKIAWVSSIDYEPLTTLFLRWWAKVPPPSSPYWYACATLTLRPRRQGFRGFQVLMHRIITNAAAGMDVDHISHCVTDNRRSNLRVVTHAANLKHQRRRAAFAPMPRPDTFPDHSLVPIAVARLLQEAA